MKPLVVGESTLTDRYQTTVPAPVRKALKLGKRSKLSYEILDDGRVLLSRADTDLESDPVLKAFLEFLDRDMAKHPERIQPLTQAWFKKMKSLTKGVKYDLDKPLDPKDE